MRSIRWRLTFAYALALLATMIAFGATLYIARQQTSARAADQRLHQRIMLEAELSVGYLERSHRVLGRLVTIQDTLPTLEPAIARENCDVDADLLTAPPAPARTPRFSDWVVTGLVVGETALLTYQKLRGRVSRVRG